MVGGGEAIYYLRKWGHARAKILSGLPKGVYDSKKLARLDQKHLNRMETLGHTVSKRTVEWCLENEVGTLVIANNVGWKQRVKLGRHNNRRFYGIPHQNMRSKIEYKCVLSIRKSRNPTRPKHLFLTGISRLNQRKDIK